MARLHGILKPDRSSLTLRRIRPWHEGYVILVKTLQEITGNSGGGKLTFGLFFALYSGSGGMTQVMSTLKATYEVHERRSWLRVHLISFALTIVLSLLTITALLLLLAGGSASSLIGNAFLIGNALD